MALTFSTARGRAPGHPTFARTLAVADGKAPPFSLFTRDVRPLLPSGSRAWLVVRYAGQLVATGEVRVVVG